MDKEQKAIMDKLAAALKDELSEAKALGADEAAPELTGDEVAAIQQMANERMLKAVADLMTGQGETENVASDALASLEDADLLAGVYGELDEIEDPERTPNLDVFADNLAKAIGGERAALATVLDAFMHRMEERMDRLELFAAASVTRTAKAITLESVALLGKLPDEAVSNPGIFDMTAGVRVPGGEAAKPALDASIIDLHPQDVRGRLEKAMAAGAYTGNPAAVEGVFMQARLALTQPNGHQLALSLLGSLDQGTLAALKGEK